MTSDGSLEELLCLVHMAILLHKESYILRRILSKFGSLTEHAGSSMSPRFVDKRKRPISEAFGKTAPREGQRNNSGQPSALESVCAERNRMGPMSLDAQGLASENRSGAWPTALALTTTKLLIATRTEAYNFCWTMHHALWSAKL
jgi:hypothetical protein